MKVLIVGAGSVGASIAKELMMNGHDVTIIDSKPEAKKRADLPGVRWHIGDACELSVLRQVHPNKADVVVAATGDDKTNLMVSLLARSEFGVPRTPSTPYRMTTPSSVTAWITCSGPSIRCSPQSCVTALQSRPVPTWRLRAAMSCSSSRPLPVRIRSAHCSHSAVRIAFIRKFLRRRKLRSPLRVPGLSPTSTKFFNV